MADFLVPVLGAGVREATVGRWLKQPGEKVRPGDVVVELETESVALELPAGVEGVLSEIVAPEGARAAIGAVLARIAASASGRDETGLDQTRTGETEPPKNGKQPPPAAPEAELRTGKMDIKVPAMGESVTEGTLANWLVKPGQMVAQDDPVAEIETDKVAIEVPAPAAGQISEFLVQEGETVSIGTIIGRLSQGGAAAAGAKPSASASPPPGVAAPPAQAPQPAQPARSNGPTLAPPIERASDKVAPSVQRIAAEAAVDPAAIPGTGKGGRATKADALQYVASSAAQPAQKARSEPEPRAPRELGPREERVKMTRLRQTIARRLKEAQDTAAMLTTFNDVDMHHVMELRKKYKDAFEKKHGVRLGFMGFFVKACVAALKEIPAVNAEIDGGDIIYKNFYNVGVAVGTDKGLVVPVVRDADVLTLAEIEGEIGRLGALARDGKLALEDLQGGTFTITNGGVYGSLMSTPILNPPQSGVLGMHRIEERPVAVAGKVEIRPMMYLALSYDHRLVDGKEAVTFLVRVKEALEDPERMLLDV